MSLVVWFEILLKNSLFVVPAWWSILGACVELLPQVLRMMGLWSLPPSCLQTSLLVIFWMSSVKIARSGLLVAFHALE